MIVILGNKNYINKFINSKTYVNEFCKPYFKDKNVFFNKSHTDKLSILMFSKYECGIDIENIKEYNELIVNKMCTKEEIEYLNNSKNKDISFTMLFTLKEAYLKCLGVGLNYKLKDISFVKNNKLNLDHNGFKIEIYRYYNYLISMCRRVV